MSKTFVINEIVDATENNSFSLVDSDLNNKGTVLIKDGKITLYWENGDKEINFDEDYGIARLACACGEYFDNEATGFGVCLPDRISYDYHWVVNEDWTVEEVVE